MRNKSISLSNILSKIISSWHISRSSWKVAYDMIKLQPAQLGPAWPWIPEGPSWGYRVKVSVIAINVIICSRLLIDTISATAFASHYTGKTTHEKHRHSYFHGWVILDLLYQLGLLFMASDKGVEERAQAGARVAGVWDFSYSAVLGIRSGPLLPTFPLWRIVKATWLPKV